MRINGVNDGNPAQKAGLQRGDIITKISDFNINCVQDYMKVLQSLEKGQKIKLQVIRNNQTKEFEPEI
jgi:S1-C subfamily serine protease